MKLTEWCINSGEEYFGEAHSLQKREFCLFSIYIHSRNLLSRKIVQVLGTLLQRRRSSVLEINAVMS